MKKTKIFLAALLMLVLTATAVFADGSVFTLSDVSGRPGDVVKVDIFLSADEMIDTIGLRDIEFDEDVLTFKGFSDYDEIEDKAIISQFDNGKGAAVIGFEDAEAFDGKICSVKFYIADDADEGTYDVDMLSSLKLGSEQLDSSVEAGSVTVCHQITGDLSLDNNVDLKDAILLLQYSMFPELYPLDYLGSADFNGDDEVDMNDAILLLQYSMFPDLYPLNPDGGEDEDEDLFAGLSVFPKHGAETFTLSQNIIFSFDEAVFDDGEDKLTASYLENHIELRKDSVNGTELPFAAFVASTNRKITINPDANFVKATKYYVIIPEGTLTNEDGDENDEIVFWFITTGYVDEENERNVRVVSDVRLDIDEDNLWRFYYDLYDPYTGEKVEGVASVEGENKASMLDESTAYKRGSIIRLDGGKVNHKEEFFEGVVTGEELVYITEVDEAEGCFTVANYNKVTNNGTIECKECIDDSIENFDGYVYDFTTGYKIQDGNGDDTLLVRYDENTVVSVITRDHKFETINHWADGVMTLSDMAAVADADKSLLCWNDWVKDRNGSYKKGYADYVKAYVSVVDEKLDEDELPTADFIIVIVNKDESAALDAGEDYCGNDAH